jgi:hypothetical protein
VPAIQGVQGLTPLADHEPLGQSSCALVKVLGNNNNASIIMIEWNDDINLNAKLLMREWAAIRPTK